MNNNMTRGEVLRSALTLYHNLETILINDIEEIKNYIQTQRHKCINKYIYILSFNNTEDFKMYALNNYRTVANNKNIKKYNNTYFLQDSNELDLEFLNSILELINNIDGAGQKIVTEPYENLLNTIKKEYISNLNTSIKQFPNATLNKIDNNIKNLNNELDSLISKITQIKNNLKEAYYKRGQALINLEESPIEKLIKYIKKCSNINSICIYKESIHILTEYLPIYYTFQEEIAEKYINNMYKNQFTIDVLINATTSKDKYLIYTNPSLIKINYDIESLSYFIDYAFNHSVANMNHLKFENNNNNLIEHVNSSYFRNTHWFDYTCLGGFKVPIVQANTELNMLKLLITLMQYLETINIADYAGTKWLQFPQHLIYDKENDKFFILRTGDGSIINIPKSYLEVHTPVEFIERDLL